MRRAYTYNTTSLKGPGKGSSFSDGAERSAMTFGLIVLANPEADICPTSFTQAWLQSSNKRRVVRIG